MNQLEFRKKFIKEQLEIPKDYGRVFSFVDFANVNNWFKKDNQDWNNKLLADDEKISIDLKKLKSFADIFSERTMLYYGEDPKNSKSLVFTYVLRKIFGKRDVKTKDLQKIKHYLNPDEINSASQETLKYITKDGNDEKYIEIRKSDFDVEISVDAIKMLKNYDTFCIFSGDSDFVYLNNFLRKKGKKVIIIKAGYILTKLKRSADLIINAQKIKSHIAQVITKKQKPD